MSEARHLAQLNMAHCGNIGLAIEQLAGGWKDAAVEKSKKSSLARAGRAEQCNLFPGGDIEGYVPENDRRMSALSELPSNSFEIVGQCSNPAVCAASRSFP